MKRLAVLLLPVLVSGCLNWQGAYDAAARAECQRLVDAAERQACLNRVIETSRTRATRGREAAWSSGIFQSSSAVTNASVARADSVPGDSP
jgi:hypothetical protein